MWALPCLANCLDPKAVGAGLGQPLHLVRVAGPAVDGKEPGQGRGWSEISVEGDM